MPIVSLQKDSPFTDGRQSGRALQIKSGVERLFGEGNWALLPELTLDNGRRADLVAVSPKGGITIVEIKSSVADFRADSKWPDYLAWCDQFYFATLSDVPAEIFPASAGLIIADRHGAHIVRDHEGERMKAHLRKTVHLRFARAAATRLSACCAHAGYSGLEFAESGS
ncbi:MAG: MmcB family DNA repair protein [Ahrensia sp.]|nr:MmcB family DNA repair protein [Ahrensia sp.]